MNLNVLEKPAKNINSFSLNVELKILMIRGVVNFSSR